MDEAFAKYVEDATRENKKSIKDDIGRYDNNVREHIGHNRLCDIKEITLQNLIQKAKKKGLSDKTISHILSLVRRIFYRMSELEHYTGVIPKRVLREKIKKIDSSINNRRIEFLTPHQAMILLGKLKEKSLQVYQIAFISLYTGMRADEIFSLTWDDISFYNKSIFVKQSKNGEQRHIHMREDVINIIKEIEKKENKENYVFTTKFKGKLKEMSPVFREVCDELYNQGLDYKTQIGRQRRICFHSLRHTYASWLVKDGVPLYTVRELLGHKDIKMTMKYSHLCPDHKKDVVNALPSFFNELEC